MQRKHFDYDSFNARYLSYKQVAESFIPNDEYEQLLSLGSMLLMGPRGCGKTTLLKMLTPMGMHYFNEKNTDRKLETINFSSIYISCDIQWKNQLEHFKRNLGDSTSLYEPIVYFLFTTNVLLSICKTFSSMIDFNIDLEEKKVLLEHKISKSLIKVWELEDTEIATFDSIESSLERRVKFVNRILGEFMLLDTQKQDISRLPKYIYDNFLTLTQQACRVYENVASWRSDHKWALCFDELEIAPMFIQILLMKYLRSVDQKFLFKLTTTPLFNLENNIVEASQGNDYSTIKLWVYDESGAHQWQKFCRELITNKIAKQFCPNEVKIDEMFGEYNFDEIIRSELSELDTITKGSIQFNNKFLPGTGKGSSVNYLFRYLAKKDRSFRTFLEKRSINPDDPFAKNKHESKSIFLKYKVDAVFRMLFFRRTRRNPPIHFGLPYLFDLADGNPRLVIGLIDDILRKYRISDSELGKIPNSLQSQTVIEASEKYYNLIQNHPDSTTTLAQREINLANDIIEPIGRFMHSKIVQDEFSITSPSTFIVDENINTKHLRLLEIALYLGAIIYLDPIESLSNSGLVNKRFRLSNFLSAKFKIPSRISSQVLLSTILNIQKEKQQTQLPYYGD